MSRAVPGWVGVVWAVVAPWLAAQPVYQCGTQYSDRPCADAKLRTDLADPRTDEQRWQAREHGLRQGWMADELEQQRLRREEALRAAQRLPEEPPQAAAPAAPSETRRSRRPKDFKVRLPKPPKRPKTRPASG
ncbi:MAG: hypothetical protein KatS3mg122_0293 [Caldimonas sp.]|jgi:hypothetical protein|uniref:hypothetical protein n=1 Tax=Caldimonas taiwanensis TaxID=307483 RepID=UPI0007815FFE|nr:hypothetical protein [Caldimonas taiwanensis]GIX23062.1 MAG: hypothetical protein KatS3mg122_0293 [Caldimonas sp.]